MNVRVYLSGKMSGLSEAEYTAVFSRAESYYKSCGFEVVNPCLITEIVQTQNPNAEYEDYMKADLAALAECTHIALLENWEDSSGAKREKAEAERLGIEVMFYKELKK